MKPSPRPYPRLCGQCGKESVKPAQIDSYNAEVKYDGELRQFIVKNLPIDQCDHCKTQWFGLETDDAIQDALHAHLRESS